MSWSVNATGKPAEVKTALEPQFASPLAEVGGLADPGERETVRLIREMICQCLDTFAADQRVYVSAFGHMGYKDWDAKAGAYQNVELKISPTNAG
jgi:hypothetical protein